MKMKPTALALMTTALFSISVHAIPVISFGDNGIVKLLPDLAGQVVEFWVSEDTGGTAARSPATMVQSFELNIQVGGGGIELGGPDVGPKITNVDLITGTIFADFAPNQQRVIEYSRAQQHTVDTALHVAASGRVATITFSTEGVEGGEFALLLKGVAGANDTKFFNGVPEVETQVPTFSVIQIVPEPATAGVFGVLGVAALFRRSRHREEIGH